MKYKGLKKIAGETKHLSGCYDMSYYQLFFDVTTNTAFTIYHCDLGGNSYSVINDDNVLCCGFIHEKMTQKQIEKMIDLAIKEEQNEK